MLNYIIQNDLHDKDYIEERTEKFDEIKEAVKSYTLEKVAKYVMWIKMISQRTKNIC